MGIGIAVVVIIIVLILIKNLVSLGLKIAGFIILALVLGATVYLCTSTPEMHKPFSLNTIEYLFKINKDGSMTTTKQITQTVYKEQSDR